MFLVECLNPTVLTLSLATTTLLSLGAVFQIYQSEDAVLLHNLELP